MFTLYDSIISTFGSSHSRHLVFAVILRVDLVGDIFCIQHFNYLCAVISGIIFYFFMCNLFILILFY